MFPVDFDYENDTTTSDAYSVVTEMVNSSLQQHRTETNKRIYDCYEALDRETTLWARQKELIDSSSRLQSENLRKLHTEMAILSRRAEKVADYVDRETKDMMELARRKAVIQRQHALQLDLQGRLTQEYADLNDVLLLVLCHYNHTCQCGSLKSQLRRVLGM
ncbi:hypothetical protein VKT23_014017 [Stygiomarasmius scandens]|uniref:Uncharacterized protein n=1 Tax=Marasmiellus scandens TaxID=2682957 RepID=A0ABR1J6G7_9AGAR